MNRLNGKKHDVVTDVAKQYVDVGTEVITTNTFRTNQSILKGIMKRTELITT